MEPRGLQEESAGRETSLNYEHAHLLSPWKHMALKFLPYLLIKIKCSMT